MYFEAIVLGSKPVKRYPKIKVRNIITSNASAIKKKNFQVINHIAICGTLEFKKNNVKKKIIVSKPNKVIFISGKTSKNEQEYLKRKKIKNVYLTNFEQLNFQRKFFKYGILSIIYAEIFYEKKIIDKLIHFVKILLGKKKLKGASTGFYCILYSLHKFKGQILTSGFSMKHGKIFYKSKYPVKDGRARVDSILVKLLKTRFIKRIVISDLEMSRFKIFKFLKT